MIKALNFYCLQIYWQIMVQLHCSKRAWWDSYVADIVKSLRGRQGKILRGRHGEILVLRPLHFHLVGLQNCHCLLHLM